MNGIYFIPKQARSALDRVLFYPLTIIEAASGYGKTTVVHEYFFKEAAPNVRQLNYVCLGESAASGWKGICKVLETIDMEAGRYLTDIGVPSEENLSDIYYQMRNLHCDKPTVFCIDNFQSFQVEIKDKLLEGVSTHTCPNLHFIILTQPYPRVSGERLKGRYGIHYIEGGELCFSKADIQAFFHQKALQLKENELTEIWEITGGYASAVCLQMKSLDKTGHLETVKEISVLMEKVLWKFLSSPQRECLIRLAVLEHFSIRQACRLTEDLMSLEVLERFLWETDFVRFQEQTGQYTCHQMLWAFLKDKFELLTREQQQDIWRKAARVLEDEQAYIRAAELYGKCKDYKQLLQMPFHEDDRVDLIQVNEGNLVMELIAPDHAMYFWENPEMLLSLTLELYVQGRIPLFMRYLSQAEELMTRLEGYEPQRVQRLRGEYALLQSFLVFNDVELMCRYHQEAYCLLQGKTRLYSLNTAWTFGIPSVVCMFYRNKGALEQEYQAVAQGIPTYYKLSGGNGTGAPQGMLGEIQLLRGNYKEAGDAYRKALSEADLLEQDSICYCAYLGMARLGIVHGNVATYMHMQENMEDKSYKGREARCVYTTEVCRAYLDLLLGRYEEIPQWFYHKEIIQGKSIVFARPFVYIIYGGLLLAQLLQQQIDYSKFEIEVHQLIEESQGMNMLLPLVYHGIYLAIGNHAFGQPARAKEYLEKTISFGAPDGLLFPFVEHYRHLKPILDTMVLGQELKPIENRIHRKGKQFERGKADIRAALYVTDCVLTPREREIAHLLKQRLSVKEIAEKLCISKSTVSNMMQSIYSKLKIHSKKELYYRKDI